MTSRFFLTTTLLCLYGVATFAQQKQAINLKEALANKQLSIVNRKAEPVTDKGYAGIRLSKGNEEGLAWINGYSFSEGTIDFDIKGQDVFQQSFVGVAFHGQNDSTYEAIYFRPFNFYATDSVRYIHAVQYVAHPVYTWKKLREDRNGQFEKAIPNAPAPNDWFHAKVVVGREIIQVFIEKRPDPVLRISRLHVSKNGRFGLFTGDGSGGDFANIVVEPATSNAAK